MAKDLFSNHSKLYAQFRPTYPQELFDYIFQFVEERKWAWDCATGNGQAAVVLANHFEKVEASDISEQQINNAIKKPNINYRICSAEQTPFGDNSFDLITVAQAYHWLNWKAFHKEAARVGKSNAVVAVWTYSTLFSNNQKINNIIQHFYRDIAGPYWGYERRYVDDGYATTGFDFSPLPSKQFELRFSWKMEQLTGYLQTWSAVQKYIKANGDNPVELIQKDLNAIWKEGEQKEFHFPIFLRVGRIEK